MSGGVCFGRIRILAIFDVPLEMTWNGCTCYDSQKSLRPCNKWREHKYTGNTAPNHVGNRYQHIEWQTTGYK